MRSSRDLCFRGLAAAVVLSLSARALADEPPTSTVLLSGQTLTLSSDGTESTIPLGCEGRASVRKGDLVYVACGVDGVAVVDVSDPAHPRVVERRDVGGEATDVRLVDGELQVQRRYQPREPLRVVAEQPSLLFPPRVGNALELSVGAIGILNVGPTGGAGLFSGSATYRFGPPLYVTAAIDPAGIAAGRPNEFGRGGATLGVLNAHVSFGLDSRWGEAGFGVGEGTLRYGGSTNLMLVSRVRLGPRDGLHLQTAFWLVAKEGVFREWMALVGVQVPFATRWAFELDGRFGATRDSARGLLGVRYRVDDGEGKRGVWLTVSAGGALVAAKVGCVGGGDDFSGVGCTSFVGSEAFYAGPALGAAVDWRF